MNAVGIVSEFNPFHSGHKYLIEQVKLKLNADVVISVMGGNFLQRGNLAIYDKHKRAMKAVESGVDLVLELPAVYACSSARIFAKGAISILEGIGGINFLAFGSESGDIEKLLEAANVIKRVELENADSILKLLKEGISYPVARQAVIDLYGKSIDRNVLSMPNNVLGLEYIMASKSLVPITVKRSDSGYHESATRIREKLMTDDNEQKRILDMEERFFDILRYKIISSLPSELEEISSAGEGLGNKLKNEIRFAKDKEELIERVKSKRYTYTRISRLLTQTVLGIDRKTVAEATPYINVLAFNEKGSNFIRNVKDEDKNTLQFVDSHSKAISHNVEITETLAVDIRASDLYNIVSNCDMYKESDYVKKPIVINNKKDMN